MQHADDLLALAPPQRQPGMGAFQRRIDDLLGRQFHVDGVHLGPVHHDVGDGELAQIEHAAQHVAVELDHAAFLVMQRDGAAQLLMRRQHLGVVADGDAEQPQSVADQELHGGGYRRKYRHEEVDGGCHRKRHLVGVDDGVSLGQHLDEQHHDHGHHHGGVDHPCLAEDREKQARGKRGGGDVGEAVAEQDGADQSFADQEEPVDDAGVAIAVLLERMHARAGGGRQRRLGTGEKGRDDEKTQNGAERNSEAQGHRLWHSRARKAPKRSMATSRSTKAWPTPRTSTRASLPALTFLSCAMS